MDFKSPSTVELAAECGGGGGDVVVVVTGSNSLTSRNEG
jgi:hypothetical protein